MQEQTFADAVELTHSSCAQALLIPNRIRTLLLTSTHSGSRFTLPSWKAASMFLRLSSGTVRTPAAQIELVTNTLFPEAWLEEEVREEGEFKGKKRREQVEAVRLWIFRTCSRHRFGADPDSHPLAGLLAALQHRSSPNAARPTWTDGGRPVRRSSSLSLFP